MNFWGGAMCTTQWKRDRQGRYHEETLLLAELDLDQLHRTRARLPLLRDERTALVSASLPASSRQQPTTTCAKRPIMTTHPPA